MPESEHAQGFRDQLDRRAREREEVHAAVADSITTHVERTEEEDAARLANLQQRIAALSDYPEAIDLDKIQ